MAPLPRLARRRVIISLINSLVGIDIYAEWRGQTEDEAGAQCTGFSGVHGHVGYLREAYHGGPYVTKYLVAEAFAAANGEAAIPSRTLRERLPAAVLMHMYREHKRYGNGKEPGRLHDIAALKGALRKVFTKELSDASHEEFAAALTSKSLAAAEKLIAADILPDTARAFVDFVLLCERKEAETREPVTIIASY